ncbi:hypothetical protein COV19_02195 [Candidatus Woesearchaeota archaeon CG10_big_fil_rev_8_21_14_0_10_44_13]|nr:MAG: hypothetical protein COV19_02195 [Candidatus Woesearchaeota archaeon CG10_big_fil_rev_8_21_14_0_10_44_13]
MAEKSVKTSIKKDFKNSVKNSFQTGFKKASSAPSSASLRPALRSKKAVSTWISWVLLVTFVIFIGTTIFYWMKDYSTTAMADLANRVKTTEDCDLVSIQVSDVTSKNAQTLNMKVTNRYNLRIDQIVISLYDSKNRFILSNLSNTTLRPNSTKEIEFEQNSSIATARLEAIPVIIDAGKQIYCMERKVEINVTS